MTLLILDHIFLIIREDRPRSPRFLEFLPRYRRRSNGEDLDLGVLLWRVFTTVFGQVETVGRDRTSNVGVLMTSGRGWRKLPVELRLGRKKGRDTSTLETIVRHKKGRCGRRNDKKSTTSIRINAWLKIVWLIIFIYTQLDPFNLQSIISYYNSLITVKNFTLSLHRTVSFHEDRNPYVWLKKKPTIIYYRTKRNFIRSPPQLINQPSYRRLLTYVPQGIC